MRPLIRRSPILRAALYGILLFLLVATGYLYFGKSSNEPPADVEMAGSPPVSSDRGTEQPSGKTSEGFSDPAVPPELLAQSHAGGSGEKVKETSELATRAREMFGSGDYRGAAGLFRELSGKDNSAFTAAGVSYFKLGDYEKAGVYLEKAVELNPNDFVARKFLAFVCYKKDDIGKSLSHAEAALSVRKDAELRNLAERLRRDKLAREAFVEESTLHFRLHFDGYEHGGISRAVIGMLEEAYSVIGKELDHFPAEPVNVVLHTNRDFFDITQAPEWSGGIYDGRIRIPVRGIKGDEPVLRAVLFHEFSHAVVHSITPRCPLWINEGLAEYFSRGPSPGGGGLISLGSIEKSFAWLGNGKIGLAYRESHSAVTHLVDRYGMDRMKTFLHSLSKGAGTGDAFREAFGLSYEEFLSGWGGKS